MKTRRNKNTSKNSVNSKLCMKTYGHNTKRTWGLGNNVTTETLESLNEAICVNKTQRAVGKGSWKLVPKDSCEIYKERLKRKSKNEDRLENDTSEDETYTRKTERRIVRRRQYQRTNRRKNTRPRTRRRINCKREEPSDSSIDSDDCDCDCNCESPSSSASSPRSSVTFSDMEYD